MEWVVGIICLLGGAFAVIAGVGTLRLQDVLIRMHASTKAGTLASGLVLAAVALHFRDAEVTSKAVIAVLFLVLTAPIAAHMLGRAALKLGVPLWQPKQVAAKRAAPESDASSDI